jgi:hypothetical protein
LGISCFRRERRESKGKHVFYVNGLVYPPIVAPPFLSLSLSSLYVASRGYDKISQEEEKRQ